MQTVKISPKFQVVIPKELRDAMHLRVGETMHMLQYNNRLELIPEKDMRSMRGFLKGIDTTIAREKDRT